MNRRTRQKAQRIAAGLLTGAMLSACQTTEEWGYESGYAPGEVTQAPYFVSDESLDDLQRRTAGDGAVAGFEAPTYARQQEALTAQRLAQLQGRDAQESGRGTFAQRHLTGGQASTAVVTTPQAQTQYPVSNTTITRTTGFQSQPLVMDTAPATQVIPTGADPSRYSVSGIPPMPAATAGECFALVRKPAEYRTVQRQIQVAPAQVRHVTEPAQYVTEMQTMVVREGYDQLQVVPPQFNTVTERVATQPASAHLVTEPAQYRDVTERVMVRPARMVWKPGRGPVERIDHSTGQIMCLVEEPAEYRTVTRRVLVQPEQQRQVQQPAQYQTVTRQVVGQPAQVRRVHVPAQVQQVPVRRQVRAAQVRQVQVPPQYESVQAEEVVQPARLEWREVLCETNMTPGMMRQLQLALRAQGFDPGPIDGIVGQQTMRAVNAFQRARGLPVDRYLNVETVRALGLSRARG